MIEVPVPELRLDQTQYCGICSAEHLAMLWKEAEQWSRLRSLTIDPLNTLQIRN